jgi:hypothetical protein
MKKLITILFGVLLVLGMSVPAMATVLVWGTVSLDKEITVNETVKINKTITIDVDIDDLLSKAAEANSTINQDNLFNWACENCAEKVASITTSINGNVGVTNVNQATGNMNNQGNVVSVAVDVFPPQPEPPGQGEDPPETAGGLAHAQTAVNQNMGFNEIVTFDLLFRNAFITDSINNNKGIVGVNQSAGNINNQLNVVTAAVCLDGLVALAEADLGQINTDLGLDPCLSQSVFEFNTNKNATVTNSVNGNTGIVGVNQTVGNMAQQANIATVAASIR